LGAAVVLASQGSHLPQVALLMGIFGIGAALPIVALAYVSRGAMLKMRGKLMQAGKTGKMILGAVMIALAAMILSGADKPVESWLVEHSPAWLTQLTTRF
jgi:cytochrome c biogenesis protein CcdA